MINRRAFIKDILRSLFIGSLLAGSGYLLFRGRQEGQKACYYDFLCRDCKKLASCSLPEGKYHREKAKDHINHKQA
jgi:hypothetical protein